MFSQYEPTADKLDKNMVQHEYPAVQIREYASNLAVILAKFERKSIYSIIFII
jgi:hypothetical protein